MDVTEAIKTRFSVRHFSGEDVFDEEMETILEAGRAAPSGLNNQPWRFAVVRDGQLRDKLAGFSKYGRVLSEAKVLVAVFFDHNSGYNRDKDMHGIGACIQNIWLAAHSMGIGMCWVGEILNRREDVENALGVKENLELMAVLCFGRPDPDEQKEKSRLPIEDLIVLKT